jgi:hypothetical protein
MKKWVAAFLAILTYVYFSSDFFSIQSISGHLVGDVAEPLSEEAALALSQPYHYLGKGKQAFAFLSADGKWVVKFFNQKYFKLPFWAAIFPKERTKRESRKKYYEESYEIAAKMLRQETGIVYLHQGLSLTPLPRLFATDKRGRSHGINLNEIPFVLQRRVELLYPALEKMDPEELDAAINQFLSLIALRIDLKIGDGDHDVEHNFGFWDGKVIHLDPGRLYKQEALWEHALLKYEWWSATHQFRKWLEKNYPERIISFDEAIETNQQRVLQQSQASPSPQKGALLQVQFPAFSNNSASLGLGYSAR